MSISYLVEQALIGNDLVVNDPGSAALVFIAGSHLQNASRAAARQVRLRVQRAHAVHV